MAPPALLLLLLVVLALRTRSGRRAAPELERRVGWATGADLRRLYARATERRRIPLGRFGHRRLAAEELVSVLVVGPSQSGKTTRLAIPALLSWDGPVLATSVKSDLVRRCAGERAELGEVAVFDPAGVTGLAGSSWSPLEQATSWGGARRVAEALCSVGRRTGGIEEASYWYAAAERLIAPLLRAAALSSGSMAEVVRWLDEDAGDEPSAVLELAREHEALRVARSVFTSEERYRASVVATAQTVVAAYGDPAVLACERTGRPLGPSWLLEGAGRRTLFCCAPARDQARLSPVFVALVRAVLDVAFTRAAAGGGPLDPPLLVVLDEAANVAPIGDLDQVLATGAGHGVTLLTVWQDLAQAEARYGERWATIVNNHRAKVVFPGVADPRTLELVSALVGDVEAPHRSRSRGRDGVSETESPWRVPVAPAGLVRRLPAGRVLLVYGGLPPALLRAGTEPSLLSRAAAAFFRGSARAARAGGFSRSPRP